MLITQGARSSYDPATEASIPIDLPRPGKRSMGSPFT